MEAASTDPSSVNVHETLGVITKEYSPDRVVMELAIGPHVQQPMGLLHGGISALLAESAASMGAYSNCDPTTQYVVGIDLNISHLAAKKTGTLRAIATPVRKGRTIHVWGIDLEDENGKAVAVARCTLAIKEFG